MAREIIKTKVTFCEGPHETGMISDAGLFADADAHFAGVCMEDGRTWTVPLFDLVKALEAAGFQIEAPTFRSR